MSAYTTTPIFFFINIESYLSYYVFLFIQFYGARILSKGPHVSIRYYFNSGNKFKRATTTKEIKYISAVFFEVIYQKPQQILENKKKRLPLNTCQFASMLLLYECNI